ncbi:MAG: CoA transferase, partial [Chloroflexi bacterium]|nr:CoA transferase [Chloroflexota bacterium]
MASLPLTGLRVLDFSRLLPGGFCTLLLADMGAEVIKVEEPGLGDPLRSIAPPPPGAWFAALHRGKKSLTLNLKHLRGREVAHRLAARADVLLENFRPGTMERLGFGWERLRVENPRLVYCSISGFGESGP